MKWTRRIVITIKIIFALWAIWNFYNKLVKFLYSISKREVKKNTFDPKIGFFKQIDNCLRHRGD